MKSTIVAITIFILGIVSFLVFNEKYTLHNFNAAQSNYDFYTFTMEWPATICKTHTCTDQYMEDQDGTHFNIHGLWPDGSGSDYCTDPATCSSVTYDESLLNSDLATWMKKWYAGLYSDSTQFHQHEFEKHGTCWNSPSTDLRTWENDFFGEIQTQAAVYDLLSAFQSAGITPSDTTGYTYQQMQSAIQNYFKTQEFGILLFCDTVSGNNYLDSIELCLDLKYQPSKCMCSSATDTCPQSGKILFPIYHKN